MIQIKNLSFSYPQHPIFKDLNLQIDSGSFTTLIGENGSGKSTFLKLVLGHLKPDSGDITINGHSAQQIIPHEIAYVSQEGLKQIRNFPATALELVMAKCKRMDRKAEKLAMESLRNMGMASHSHKLLSQLSGGQLQRTLIARELLFQPKLLILDEPSAGLDERSRKHLFSFLQELNQKHLITILLVTHHQEEVFGSVYEVKNQNLLYRGERDV